MDDTSAHNSTRTNRPAWKRWWPPRARYWSVNARRVWRMRSNPGVAIRSGMIVIFLFLAMPPNHSIIGALKCFWLLGGSYRGFSASLYELPSGELVVSRECPEPVYAQLAWLHCSPRRKGFSLLFPTSERWCHTLTVRSRYEDERPLSDYQTSYSRQQLADLAKKAGYSRRFAALLREGDGATTFTRWDGYLLNTVFLAAGAIFVCSARSIPKAFSEANRSFALQDGRCPKCGYDIRALPHRRCPECGERMTIAEMELVPAVPGTNDHARVPNDSSTASDA
jgi:hypothetical protein